MPILWGGKEHLEYHLKGTGKALIKRQVICSEGYILASPSAVMENLANASQP